jgi:hypothetical protein
VLLPLTAAAPELVTVAPAPTVRVPFRVEFVAFTTAALIMPAVMFPLPSLFTIAFGMLALVGATVQFSPSVPLVVTGEPVTVKSVAGALSPTLVTLPVPLPGCGSRR